MKKVLIMEDELNIRSFVVINLKRAGYDVIEAGCGQEALDAIAQKAIDRQIGARGLRAVMEQIMTKIMYLIPSDLSVHKVVITHECVEGGEPKLIRDKARPRTALRTK